MRAEPGAMGEGVRNSYNTLQRVPEWQWHCYLFHPVEIARSTEVPSSVYGRCPFDLSSRTHEDQDWLLSIVLKEARSGWGVLQSSNASHVPLSHEY